VTTVVEQARFRRAIERGLGLLDERFDRMASEGQTTLPGADAFQLYATYGFPLDLTEVICAERGYQVDTKGYDAALEVARERSEFKPADRAIETVYRDALAALAAPVRFSGYDQTEDRSTLAVLLVDGADAESAAEGTAVEVVTPRTPFYGEAGGQVGDRGVIETDTSVVDVDDRGRCTASSAPLPPADLLGHAVAVAWPGETRRAKSPRASHGSHAHVQRRAARRAGPAEVDFTAERTHAGRLHRIEIT
jgi:alanyl-tRNA synthetase